MFVCEWMDHRGLGLASVDVLDPHARRKIVGDTCWPRFPRVAVKSCMCVWNIELSWWCRMKLGLSNDCRNWDAVMCHEGSRCKPAHTIWNQLDTGNQANIVCRAPEKSHWLGSNKQSSWTQDRLPTFVNNAEFSTNYAFSLLNPQQPGSPLFVNMLHSGCIRLRSFHAAFGCRRWAGCTSLPYFLIRSVGICVPLPYRMELASLRTAQLWNQSARLQGTAQNCSIYAYVSSLKLWIIHCNDSIHFIRVWFVHYVYVTTLLWDFCRAS